MENVNAGTSEGKSNMEAIGNSDFLSENQDKLQQISMTCDKINKRVIAQAIIKFCGNEGTVDDKNKSVLRNLLQAAISHIPNEDPETWKNAEIKIYDYDDKPYSIKAGKGKKVFMVSLDENFEPKVVNSIQSRVNREQESRQNCLLWILSWFPKAKK